MAGLVSQDTSIASDRGAEDVWVQAKLDWACLEVDVGEVSWLSPKLWRYRDHDTWGFWEKFEDLVVNDVPEHGGHALKLGMMVQSRCPFGMFISNTTPSSSVKC